MKDGQKCYPQTLSILLLNENNLPKLFNVSLFQHISCRNLKHIAIVSLPHYEILDGFDTKTTCTD